MQSSKQKKRPSSPTSGEPSDSSVRASVEQAYGALADAGADETDRAAQTKVAETLGYDDSQIAQFAEANLGVGCGNPVGFASLREGDRVLDLGSGAGFDALIARAAVGESGHVVGVDMTRPMLRKARDNATKQGVSANVEFREGTIEALPIRDASVDWVISNCVINLSTDKAQVFREAHRVLKPGGKLSVSDILLSGELPPEVVPSMEAIVGCVGGAAQVADYQDWLRAAGFEEIHIERKAGGECFDLYQDPVARSLVEALDPGVLRSALEKVGSFTIQAQKARDQSD